jgi:hypothetical protein
MRRRFIALLKNRYVFLSTCLNYQRDNNYLRKKLDQRQTRHSFIRRYLSQSCEKRV